MSIGRWQRIVLAAMFIALPGSLRAAVPIDVQLALLANIWKLDKTFEPLSPVTMVIVYQDGYRESLLARDDVIAAVDRLKLPIRCIALEAGSESLLRNGLSEVRGQVVYVTPLRAVDVKEIARICRLRGIRSVTGVPAYVDAGIAVGIGERKGRPLILINLLAARAEGSDFSSKLLNLARIVGPLS